ncbi:MAG TPA: tripartite tricarboxylate transporter substrate binding protein [Burkholderiales bacterium]|nr:tripartite tricarboxylate transporter substrate binding protein [Burkholderiales bacterium]
MSWPLPLRGRRRLLVGLGAVAALPRTLFAQGLSSRPVRVMVPYTTGTGIDFIARVLSPKLQERWNQPFVVENRPGASGTIGGEIVAKAAPDGHTIMVNVATMFAVPHIVPNVPYDVLKSFTPITSVAFTGLALTVNRSVPIATTQEFIAYVRARPGQLNYGSPGNGTHHHLCMELFKQQTGLDIVHVPYKGLSGALTDLLGGQIDAMFLPVHTALGPTRAGQIKLLGVSLPGRHPLFPEFPSLDEQGVTGFNVDLWFGVWAPANLPPDVLAKYNREIRDIVAQPDVRDALSKQGLSPRTGTPEELAALGKAETEKWARVAREAKIKAD